MSIGAGWPGVDPFAEHTATWLLRWSRAQLDASHADAVLGPPPADVCSVGAATVILTLHNGSTAAGFTGQGSTLLEAVMSAVGAAMAANATMPRRLQLDIVQGDPIVIARPAADGKLPDTAARDAWQRLTTWQDGLVVGREGQAYWLPPTLLAITGMDRDKSDTEAPKPQDILKAAMSRLQWRARDWQDAALTIWRFGTDAWIEDATLQHARPLVQGVIPIDRIDREQLRASARAGGDFLVRILRDDGSFIYELDPWRKTQSRTAYNVVRHAGTAAALFEVAAATGDDHFTQAGVRAMRHLAGWYRPGARDGLTYVLDKDGKGKLGAAGLALLALSRKLELAPEAADREAALGIGRQIMAMQQPDGAFDSYLPILGTEAQGSVSLYYPGEAMLGLARVARLGIGEGFMAAAHRGADFLIASRQGKDRLPPDAWLMQALDVLYQDDAKPAYVEHALAIARSMLSDQHEEGAPPVFVGGFRPEPVRSTRTSARAEGLVAAYRLAERAGNARAPDVLAKTARTAPHLLAMQYTLDNSFFLDDPDAVVGGMRGGLDDAIIRIDYVQHHMSAMLGLAALMPTAAVTEG
jgi:hypothetical protein